MRCRETYTERRGDRGRHAQRGKGRLNIFSVFCSFVLLSCLFYLEHLRKYRGVLHQKEEMKVNERDCMRQQLGKDDGGHQVPEIKGEYQEKSSDALAAEGTRIP